MTKIYVKYGDQGLKMVKDILDHMDIAKQLKSTMSIGIKPNLVLAKPSHSGATTDPQVVAGIIEYLQDHGCKQISIMESSWLGDLTKRAWQVCGYTALAKRYHVSLVDLKDDSVRSCQTEDYQLEVCSSPLNVDYLINVPVLKAHCQTKLTCALKNMKGCIPDQEKRRYHRLGLHGPISQLNTAINQNLIVVDSLIGDLTFEEGDTPVQMNRIIVGQDPVAIDAYCAELLGYAPEEIDYIILANKLGVGQLSSNIIALNQEYGQPITTSTTISHLRPFINEDQACSACLGSLFHALQRLRDKHQSIPSPIHIGQGYQNYIAEGIGVGRCTNGYQKNVPGCPPSAREIITKLREFTNQS